MSARGSPPDLGPARPGAATLYDHTGPVGTYVMTMLSNVRCQIDFSTAPSDSSLFSEYSFSCTVSHVETAVHTDALARFGHALSDPTRTRILPSLCRAPGYPSELAEQIGVTRQILSNHLACLRGCGLVVAAPEGRRSRYELADRRIAAALEDLLGLVLSVDPACCPAAETEGCC